jgi:iron complex transport system substrate-binding protein
MSASKPQRIVSLNLCTDQLVLALADREHIASVTWLSADPANAPDADVAKGIVLNRGNAEEVLPLRPDLVVATAGGGQFAAALLRRLGLRVMEIPEPSTIEDIERNILRLGSELGEETRARLLVERLRAQIAAATMRREGGAPRTLVFRPGGYTPGAATLEGHVLAKAGLKNVAAAGGSDVLGPWPLERVLASQADLVVIDVYRPGEPSLAQAVVDHPAMRSYLRAHRKVEVPAAYWLCGTHHLGRVIRILAEARDALLQNRRP